MTITLDSAQAELSSHLGSMSTLLKPSLLRSLFKLGRPTGIYIYGTVGSGKTMLSRAFFESLKCKKLFVHYQDFMQENHKFFHANMGASKHDLISKLAASYKKRARVICIDEFEIKDITDAMIVGQLIEALVKVKVFVLITTNTPPENLYKDGLQRELFMPFIDFLLQKFDIFPLKSEHDYRMDRVATKRRMLYPLNDATRADMSEVMYHLTDVEHWTERRLEVFGRELVLKRTYKTVLISDFAELCQQMLSYNDYITICQTFHTIIMENVPIISHENTDEAIRFINFIDNVYFHHNTLFISMETKPEKLYVGGKRATEWKRTVSRLHEIESDTYFGAH